MPSALGNRKYEDRKIWTDCYYFHEKETRARLQLGEHADADEKVPWERAPTGLNPASRKSADEELSGRDNLLVRHSPSTVSSNSSCDQTSDTTDNMSSSLSTQKARRTFQRPAQGILPLPLFFSDPDPVGLDNPISSSSPALDDPDVFDAFLDACIEKTRALIAAAEKALRSSSSDAQIGGENGVFHGVDDDDDGVEERNDVGCEARLDDDGNEALSYVREVGRGRADAALLSKKEIVMVQGWWKVKDGEASWREVGVGG